MKREKESLLMLYFKINKIHHFYYLIYLFFFFLNIGKSNLFQYCQSITLLNGNILIIHKNGIHIYDSELMNMEKSIIDYPDFIQNENQLSKITISRFSENDYGYIISIINDKIYIFDCEGSLQYNSILEENELNGDYYTLVPIKRNDQEYTYMVGFINGNNGNNVIKYIFYNYNKNNNVNTKTNITTFEYFYINGNDHIKINEKVLSCQLMTNSSNQDIIVCFIFLNNIQKINHFFIDIEDYNMIKSDHIGLLVNYNSLKVIKSATSYDKKKSFVCFIHNDQGPSDCTIYDIENDTYSNISGYNYCKVQIYALNLYYMRETEQILLICSDNGFSITMTIFDRNLIFINHYKIDVGTNIKGMSSIYSYNKGNYYIISDASYDNNIGKNSTFFEFNPTKINYTNWLIPNITIYIEENKPKISEIMTTFLTNEANSEIPYQTYLISESLISTTYFNNMTSIPTNLFSDSIINSKTIESTNLKSNLYESYSQSIISTIESSISLSDSLIYESNKSSYPSDSDEISSMTYIFSSEPITNKIDSTISTYTELNNNNSEVIIPSSEPITNKIDSTISNYTELNNNNSEGIIPSSEPKTSSLQSTIYNIEETDSLTSKYENSIYIPSSIVSTYLITEIHEEKIDIPKKNIINNLPSIINEIEIGQTYKKIGEDYSIFIYPTNSTYLTSITHVNFTECEKILRKHYHIPDSTIMTFLQIEIENDDSKSLINQVEYQAYDGNKTLLDLSICDDINIQVIHSIKNKSLIDLDTANYFKQSGIDIFNINDSFFNDICEPYSDSDNDLILEDRIRDIYQNYSLCEDGCSYDKIDLDNLTISCECKVKDNISTVITPINLEHSEGSSTNFELIKCYNLVFSSDGKLNNIGFIIFTILVSAHIPILIYYFMKGVKPVREYIINEMKKYGYIKNNIKNKNNEKNNKNKNKRKIKNKTNDNILTKKSKSFNDGPPKRKNKNNKNENKNDKNVIIKNLKIIDNSSSLNIIKSNKKDVIPKINKKKLKINTIKESKNSIIKSSTKNKDIINTTTKKIIANLPTQNKNNIEENINDKKEKKIFKEFNLINMDLNLHRNKKYIPPDSNVILNNYTFQEALKYEDRQICEIFYIFVLSKQIFFHTFLYRSPVELFSLRLCLFIFIFSCDLALNSLFYFNDNISKKYRSSKNLFIFTFSDNIAVIILSTIVGFILLTLLAKLSNSTNAIREVFRKEEEKLKSDKNYNITEKRKNEILLEIDEILNKYKCKIIILITIEMILMIFFWYFVTAFCHVYKATQLSWLLDSFISILFRAIIELLISFGLAKLYKVAIAGESPCLYKFVMFMYNFS